MASGIAGLAKKLARRARWYYGVHLSPNPTPVQQWFRDRGDDTLRLQYPLSEESIVFDVGGYQGNWAHRITDRYNPIVYIFEPCRDFYECLTARFSANRKVKVFNYGLGNRNEVAKLALLGDGSSTYRKSERYEEITLRDVAEVISELEVPVLSLVMINIEGGEYALLDRMLATGISGKCQDMHVQFH